MFKGMRYIRFFILIVTLVFNSGFSYTAQTKGSGRSSCEVQIDKVILFARSKLGCPYEWGGSGPRTYDCSGLVNSAFRHVGIELTRTTSTMCEEGEHVNLFNIKKGDIVFFLSGDPRDKHISHVGIAITDYNYKKKDFKFIHASAGNGCVCISRFTDSNYQTTYGGARRIIRCD